MTEKRFPIVGSHYRPPAAALIAVLATGTRLLLRPEPHNPHDRFAKAIFIKTQDIPTAAFAALDDGRLKAWEMTIKDIAHEPEWHLGFIPATMAKDLDLQNETEGQFSVSVNGNPRITIDI